MPDGSRDDQLDKLIAGQASTDQRFVELFRRLDKAEQAAGEARDTAKEIATILREQNALARVAEVRAEAHEMVQGIRADLVLAHKNLREPLAVIEGRVDALEALRSEGTGAAKGFKFLIEAAKIITAVGGGAALAHMFGAS